MVERKMNAVYIWWPCSSRVSFSIYIAKFISRDPDTLKAAWKVEELEDVSSPAALFWQVEAVGAEHAETRNASSQDKKRMSKQLSELRDEVAWTGENLLYQQKE